MKKNLFANGRILALAGLPLLVIAMTTGSKAQAPKLCLFEHFTNTGCGPCAQQNPGFQNTILTPNPVKARHIAYHTPGPGPDPMNQTNPGANSARSSFYGLTGVPTIYMLGNQKQAQPGGFSQADVDNVWSNGSPVKIVVTEVDNGNNRDVTVTVTSVAAPPAGSFNLYVACIQRNANYTTAPGSNGEKNFPNVFRAMISGGALGQANGVAITLPAQGSSVTMGPYNYLESWAVNSQITELAGLAWIQNTSTKEVIQSGATFDPPINGTMAAPSAAVKNGSSVQAFNFTTGNLGTASESFTYTLSTDAPANWSADYVINSVNYTSATTLNIPANTNYPVQINVTPGATPAVAKYTLTMQSQTNPSSPSMTMNVYVISGVTDLIVSNSAGQGDNTGTGLQYEPDYVAGLQYANNTSTGKTDDIVLLRAMQDNAMGQIKYIYWNVAWTNPAIPGDNIINELTTFLNGGGCLFISGQDIGWDVMDAGGNGTAITKAFYTNFLNAAYVNDGTTANSQLTANSSDPVFGTAGTAAISSAVYTATYTFPDELNAVGVGQVIFHYNGNTAKKAGIRATNGTYKTVYLGVGIEQLGTAAAKNTILKMSHDWFHLATSTEDFDNAMMALSLGQNFPNPAVDFTYIPFSEFDKDVTLQVMDMSGRILAENKIEKGSVVFKLNTSGFESGMYMYRITDGINAGNAKPLQVIR